MDGRQLPDPGTFARPVCGDRAAGDFDGVGFHGPQSQLQACRARCTGGRSLRLASRPAHSCGSAELRETVARWREVAVKESTSTCGKSHRSSRARHQSSSMRPQERSAPHGERCSASHPLASIAFMLACKFMYRQFIDHRVMYSCSSHLGRMPCNDGLSASQLECRSIPFSRHTFSQNVTFKYITKLQQEESTQVPAAETSGRFGRRAGGVGSAKPPGADSIRRQNSVQAF